MADTLSAEVQQCLAAYASGQTPDKSVERAAVMFVMAALKAKAPGYAVELRIPPYAAIQVIEGPRHRRGTPSAVVEMSAQPLLLLAAGQSDWATETHAGHLFASGERSNLSHLFPLFQDRGSNLTP